jgi:CheY-like chemotaxis protein
MYAYDIDAEIHGVAVVLEAEKSVHVNGESRSAPVEARESLKLWDSPDSLKIFRMPGKPLRVLLAEDNPLDQISIRRLLEKQGFEVMLAADGRRAVDMYETGKFDIVLLDILMPEMDGFEVAAKIREYEQHAGGHIPVIALTAYSLKAVYDKCRSVGMNGYLSKPIAGSDLRSLCAALIPETPVQDLCQE